MQTNMTLYASAFCPFCHACRLALTFKGLAHDVVDLDLTQKDSFRTLLSPYGRVPVLAHGAERVFESTIINEYLEEVFPERPLLPDGPAARAEVRFWVNFVQDRIVPAYFDLMNNTDPQDWPALATRLQHWFLFMERRTFNTDWIAGAGIGLADMALFPWIERFVSAERYRGASIPSECKKLRAWTLRMEANAAVATCAKPRADYIAFFDRYWTPLEGPAVT